MARPGTPVFLERSRYRQRRMMDAVRLLAVLGAGLWMLPLLWPSAGVGTSESLPMSRALLYIFGVWWVLIAAAYLLARQQRRMPETSDDAGPL
ncbi:hypothetical protein ROLI_017810 [Roseobacter fucihabitans]|uniref:DUF3311 domain-containing protein n=1 Tax=Roseobacter fucihabitans TaxID=1537242 RepID=A0ABZ2BU26_9RHOB|nr:hypothetical protein [Roseobacter litoralis]MBC6964344.1 hypothetical protein [Roseobacter litoralis]